MIFCPKAPNGSSNCWLHPTRRHLVWKIFSKQNRSIWEWRLLVKNLHAN